MPQATKPNHAPTHPPNLPPPLQRPGQERADIIRRSAGLPFALLALFYSERSNSQRLLLRRGAGELLRLAGDDAAPQAWPRRALPPARLLLLVSSPPVRACATARCLTPPLPRPFLSPALTPTAPASPPNARRVHAFNVLRACFLDSQLSSEVTGYLAVGERGGAPHASTGLEGGASRRAPPPALRSHTTHPPSPPPTHTHTRTQLVPHTHTTTHTHTPGLECCILGMAAGEWEVRNSATLCYAALLVRMLGFRNQAAKVSCQGA